MLTPAIREALRLEAKLDESFGAVPIGGSAGKTLLRVTNGARSLFVKVLPAARSDELAGEADGLEALRRAAAIAVPAVHACGVAEDGAFLALEWLDLRARTARAERRLGAALAAQHRCTQELYGYSRDNALGPTPQINTARPDWLVFWRRERLGAQLERATGNGLPRECAVLVHRVLERVDALFDAYRPQPALLHGDLWGGNWGVGPDETPYVFDPAVYFGDREADLAMTRLFGGFGPAFYRAYREAWPLDAGAERRVDLYNAYHLLNHFNIFGAAYVPPLVAALERALRA